MKKSIFQFIAITMLGLAACSSTQNKYYITGDISDPEAEGTTVYLFTGLNPNRIDSTLVEDGKFVFENPIHLNDYGFIQVGKDLYAEFILEEDTIEVDLQEHSVRGGALNNLFVSLKQAEIALSKDYEEQAGLFIERNGDHYPDAIALEAALDSLEDAYYTPKRIALNQEYFEGNENNMIGVEVLYNLSNILSTQEIEPYLRKIGPDVVGHTIVQGLITEVINEGPTGEGSMFKDFSAKQEDGSFRSLSDYVGKGNFVLVEFWASWCDGCSGELPYMKGIYEKYKGRNFEILGVAVQDDILNSLKAIEKNQIPWPQILNAQNIPSELYDFKSMPYIILFGPDGTILRRGTFKEEIVSVLMEYVN